VGTPGEIYERPANEFVAGFVGTSNIVELDGRRFTIRPEKLRVLDAGTGEPGPTVLEGTVQEVAYLGAVTRYVVALDRGGTLTVLKQNLETSAEQALGERGRRVRLTWRAEDESTLDINKEEGVHS
jgi:putative spermidine/putrescine transport system ATP-binding protein